MPKISVILNIFNTKDLLKDCLENLLKIDLNLEIIVSDSGSDDGSPQMVKQYFSNNKNVILIERGNTGVAGGYNKALEKAGGDYYLYLGSDAYPNEETLKYVLTYMEDPKNSSVGIVTTKLVTRDGKPDMDAHRGTLTPWVALTHFSGLDRLFPKSKFFNQYFLGFMDMTKPHEIGACISHFMFVRKSARKKVGNWDPDFFVYGEDIDLCFRMKKAGYKIMYLPQYETLHYKGAGMGRKTASGIKTASQSSISTKKILAKERTRAMRLYFTKHLESKYPKLIVWLVYAGIFLLEKMRSFMVSIKYRKVTSNNSATSLKTAQM